MKVMALRAEAVFVSAGSYESSPPSSGVARIRPRSLAHTAPSVTGTSYDRPVRLSTTVSVSAMTILPRCRPSTDRELGLQRGGLRLRHPHEEHRNLGLPQHGLRDRSEEEAAETAAAVGCHRDEVRVGLPRALENFIDDWLAVTDFCPDADALAPELIGQRRQGIRVRTEVRYGQP